MVWIGYRVRKRVERTILPALLRPSERNDLRRFGSAYAGYFVPMSLLSSTSICYSAGVGEDITFDLELMDKVGCEVFAFDPTPRAAEHVRSDASAYPAFHFCPVGLWHQNTTARFFAPSDRRHVSHSIYNLQKTADYFEAECKTLTSLMQELGHQRLDLLKLNIEGAQYPVIDSIISQRVPVKVLCVAIDQPTSPFRVYGTVRKLQRYGFDLVHIEGWTYTFVSRDRETGSP